jgi:5'-3' exonuclease
MGIPSYYKKLASSIKNLTVQHHEPLKAKMLLFDFNCMIYQIIRDKTLRPFPGYADEVSAKEWELEVCEKIAEYTVNVWKEVGKPKTVFLGIDGVVPMAKIRQQRLRRFKSIWMADEECKRGIRTADPNRWDTNAITPGTAFMDRLATRLEALCTTYGWIVSPASEPGEGEQKCMEFWRAHRGDEGDIVIYGLDADLILLCLLTRQILADRSAIWLFRETTEWEAGGGVAPFMRFSVNILSDTIVPTGADPLTWTLDYVAAMSLLGNDFVPHSLSIKIRDGGHTLLLTGLKRIHSLGQTLIVKKDGYWTYSLGALLELCRPWAADENQLVVTAIKHKGQRAGHDDWNLLPCIWREEERVLCRERGVLHDDWIQRMYREWFGDGVVGDAVCKRYAEGLQWIIDYYTAQRTVDPLWVYPWSLPPAWTSWVSYLETDGTFPAGWTLPAEPLKAQEQLAMVLPIESWHFIRDAGLRELPAKAPQFWPVNYTFFSAGRFFLWECEPEIPLLYLPTLRSLRVK